jgi:hypothetical protein
VLGGGRPGGVVWVSLPLVVGVVGVFGLCRAVDRWFASCVILLASGLATAAGRGCVSPRHEGVASSDRTRQQNRALALAGLGRGDGTGSGAVPLGPSRISVGSLGALAIDGHLRSRPRAIRACREPAQGAETEKDSLERDRKLALVDRAPERRIALADWRGVHGQRPLRWLMRT